jgi:polyisoprenoid-binding protein YceI
MLGGMKTSFSLIAFVGLLVGASAAERPLAFDPALSSVDVVVKATVDSFTGHLSDYRLTGVVDDNGRVTRAELTFHFKDVLTGKAKRDAAMNEWQQTDKYPDARFTLQSLEGDAGRGWRARGQLELHGITRQLEFPVAVTRDGPSYAIDGDATIDTREFGLPIIRLMGLLKVEPIVHVKFHFQGRAA